MECANDEKEIRWERIPDLTSTVETTNNACKYFKHKG